MTTKPLCFKPMLAGKVTKPEKLTFPAYVSPKIDGIRCTCFDGKGFSRSGKEFPNRKLQQWLSEHGTDLEFMDGEIVVGKPFDANCMQNSMAIMSPDADPDFTFFAFDLVNSNTFEHRNQQLIDYAHLRRGGKWSYGEPPFSPRIQVLPQYRVHSLDEANRHEAMFLEAGYEGMMYRKPDSDYKFGRSTEREGSLLKLKRFSDAEALIVGYEEERDIYGKPKGTLGAFVCRSLDSSITFKVGSGYTAEQRATFWSAREEFIGSLLTYKFFNHGIVEAPRHPVFKGIRHEIDMG